MKLVLTPMLCFILPLAAYTQIPKVASGTIRRVENFNSKYVTARNIDIWFPDNYSTEKKYAVLYMHDGQMLFDSTASWNHQEWGVDEVAGRLLREKKIHDVIIVGIWNGITTRQTDYFPQKPFESLPEEQQQILYEAGRETGYLVFGGFKINSDNYLKFLVEELKPFIDKNYSTQTDRDHTFIMGSSMGGLISIYAICEYPDVFGGAACMSTHWPGIFTMENNPIPGAFVNYLEKQLPNPDTQKIYFDYGTATLDSMYPPLQKQVDEVLRIKGFTDKNWITMEFKGQDHSERAWKKRLDIPLNFLLGNP